jgi:deoxyribonuclease-4
MSARPLIGAHESIAGGHFRAVGRALAAGCACLQVFTRNNLRWADRPLADEDCARFKAAVRDSGLSPVIAHGGYLINLASPDDRLFEKSLKALDDEMERCRRLGIQAIVLHPGAHGRASRDEGVTRVADGLNRALARRRGVEVLLETTAGSGSLGGAFEDLADIISLVRDRDRVGVCFDTCHVFAAGHDLRTRRACLGTLRRFDDALGLGRLRAFHFNDSKGDLGSGIDRHEHIGRGRLGGEAFRCLLRDGRLDHVPKVLETPKGNRGRASWDSVNLRLLRWLAGEGS